MSIQDQWVKRFRAVVASEIDAARGRASDGYRSVASKTGMGYDYIYQIYTGKPSHKPKQPSAELMDSIRRAYGDEVTGSDNENAEGVGAQAGTAELASALEKVETALEKIKAATPTMVHIEHAWPFNSLSRDQWAQLTPDQQALIEGMAIQLCNVAHASAPEKRQATG